MTTVEIKPGVCGLVTEVTAQSEDQMDVTLTVKSGCASVKKMFEELGDTFDAFEICLKKPGENEFYEYAAKNFPGHAACPTIAGIIKCMEVECKLALPRDVEIHFK